VGFVVDKLTLRQIFSEYFDLPYQFSFHQLLHSRQHHHHHHHHYLTSEVCTVGQIVADVTSGLIHSSPRNKKNRKRIEVNSQLHGGPLSLVTTIEELFERKSSGSSPENREYGRGDPSR
jgi:hypothetical protein